MAAASIKLGCATGCVNWKVEMSELVCHFRSCWKHGCFSSEKWRVIVDLSLACAAQRPQFRILAFSISAFILFGEVMPWWRIQFENSKLATFRLSAVNYGRSSHSISVVISIRAVQCWWFMCSCKRAGNVTSCSLPTFGPPLVKKKKKLTLAWEPDLTLLHIGKTEKFDPNWPVSSSARMLALANSLMNPKIWSDFFHQLIFWWVPSTWHGSTKVIPSLPV